MSYPHEPVCWSWPLPTLALAECMDAELARMETLPPDDRMSRGALELVYGSDSDYRMDVFHADRCAICGLAGRHLVDDHDHDTGLIRGYLCRGCNVAEGLGRRDEIAPAFPLYRERPPAAILGVRRYYVGMNWPHGWWENEAMATRLTANADWQRVEQTP